MSRPRSCSAVWAAYNRTQNGLTKTIRPSLWTRMASGKFSTSARNRCSLSARFSSERARTMGLMGNSEAGSGIYQFLSSSRTSWLSNSRGSTSRSSQSGENQAIVLTSDTGRTRSIQSGLVHARQRSRTEKCSLFNFEHAPARSVTGIISNQMMLKCATVNNT